LETWYNDPNTGICRPGYYGGCGGNENRYSSLAECQKACRGGNDVCQSSSDCVLDGLGCCGICDGPDLSVRSFISYNPNYGAGCAILRGAPAPIGGSGSSDIALPNPGACPGCDAPAPGTGTRQYFVPECVAGQCSVTDVRTSSATACKTNSDCRIRHGASCCETCDANLIAVRNDGSFEKLVCGGIIPPCAACPNVDAPTGAMAYCNQGRCTVAYAADESAP